MMTQCVIVTMIFNCFSIVSRAKQLELLKFLNENDVSVAILNETFLKTRHDMQITGYRIYRNDAPDDVRGAGCAILVSERLLCKQINLPNVASFSTPVAVRIFTESGNFTFVSAYVSNSTNCINFSDISALFRCGNRVFVGGDWNARHSHWNCVRANRRGQQVYDYCVKNGGRIAIHHSESPTYYPSDRNRNPSTIDFALSKNVVLQSPPKSIHELSSDHNPILFEVIADEALLESKRPLDFSKANWRKFRDTLDSLIGDVEVVLSQDALEEEVRKFTNFVNDAIGVSVPKQKPQRGQNLPPEISQMIKIKNYVRRLSRSSNVGDDMRVFLRRVVNRFQAEIKKQISHAENAAFQRKASQFRPYDANVFHEIGKITRDRKKMPPLKAENGDIVYESEAKANMLASTFSEVHSMNDSLGDPSFVSQVDSSVDDFLSSCPRILGNSLVSSEEVRERIQKLKVRKAPGFDGISNLVLKNLSEKFVEFLSTIIQTIFDLGHFPKFWKVAKVIAIPKSGKDNSIPGNNRPISLLPAVSKVVEGVIVDKIDSETHSLELLPDEQFGFRGNHSSSHAIMNVTKKANEELARGNSTQIVFLDIQKAFDCVWTNGLIYKMIEFGFSRDLIKLCHSYLTDRSFFVSVDGHSSATHQIGAGIVQGSRLGPRLFTIYTSDIPRHDKTSLSIFADDTGVFSSNKDISVASRNVQDHLLSLREYYDTWRIRVNPDKTETMTISKRRHLDPVQSITFADVPIRSVNSVVYLGVKLTSNLNFNDNVSRNISKANLAMKRLRPLLKHSCSLNTENRVMLYSLFIRPILTHNIPVWNYVCNSTYEKMQRFQNKCLRQALKLRPDLATHRQVPTRQVHELANVPFLREFAKKLTTKYYEKMHEHDNALIRNFSNIENDDVTFLRRVKSPFLLIRDEVS